MMKFEINEEDMKKLQSKLKPGLFQKGVDVALKRIGLEMNKEAAKNAPYKTGELRRSILTEQNKTSVKVGTDLIYARIHEFGGTISAKGSGYLRFKIGGQWISKKSVKIPKRPYLTPAFDIQKQGRALDIFTSELNRMF